MLEQIDAVLVKNKSETLRHIRTLYAHDLFNKGEYDTALSIFQELDADPADVIKLYPEMISGNLANAPESNNNEDDELLAPPVRKKKGDEQHEEEGSRPPSITSTRSKATTHSIPQTKDSTVVPLTGLNLHDAVTYLIRFLTDKRQRLSKKLNAGSIRSSKDSGKQSTESQQDEETLLRQATIVDTALLKAYMMTNDALVGPLLRVQNHCDVEECEAILSEKKVSVFVVILFLHW